MILAAHWAGRSEIPDLYNGKDKTFFFVSYEGLRLTAPQAATVNFVPDAALARKLRLRRCSQVLNAFPCPAPTGWMIRQTVLPNSLEAGPTRVRSIPPASGSTTS